jgi:peptidoglycan/xylan/chitin deacetylase (PgdA/CDA1 family)
MLKGIRALIKSGTIPIAYAVGGERLLWKFTSRNKLIVLYHGVSSSECFDINMRHLTAMDFEDHLLYYKKHFSVVSLSEINKMRQEKKTTEKPIIALTFDDGFCNNLDVILPLLEKHSMPATFFITTAPLATKEDILNCELLEIGCAYSGKNIVSLGSKQFKRLKRFEWVSEDGQNIYDYFQDQSPEAKDDLIKEWKERYELDRLLKKIDKECYGLMNTDELKVLSSSPLVEIGSHAHHHHYLTSLNDESLRFELSNSKRMLEQITGKKINSIAFPNGRYDERVLKFCREEGYNKLVSVGLNSKNDRQIQDLYPRADIGYARKIAFNMATLSRNFLRYGF